jgi:hypothetical protein
MAIHAQCSATSMCGSPINTRPSAMIGPLVAPERRDVADERPSKLDPRPHVAHRGTWIAGDRAWIAP